MDLMDRREYHVNRNPLCLAEGDFLRYVDAQLYQHLIIVNEIRLQVTEQAYTIDVVGMDRHGSEVRCAFGRGRQDMFDTSWHPVGDGKPPELCRIYSRDELEQYDVTPEESENDYHDWWYIGPNYRNYNRIGFHWLEAQPRKIMRKIEAGYTMSLPALRGLTAQLGRKWVNG